MKLCDDEKETGCWFEYVNMPKNHIEAPWPKGHGIYQPVSFNPPKQKGRGIHSRRTLRFVKGFGKARRHGFLRRRTENPNTEEFWRNKIKASFTVPVWDPITKDRFSTIINLIPAQRLRLLDIGVGYGFFEIEAKRKKPLLDIVGLDITSERMKTLKKKSLGTFVVGSALKLPFRRQSFDYVCLLEVLEHLYEDEGVKSLDEVSRILRMGGTLIVSVPLFDKPFTDHPSGHVREITPEKIIHEVKDGRFEIRRLIPLVAFKSHYFLKTIVNKISPLRRPNNLIIEAVKL